MLNVIPHLKDFFKQNYLWWKEGMYRKFTNEIHPKNHMSFLYKTEETPQNYVFFFSKMDLYVLLQINSLIYFYVGSLRLKFFIDLYIYINIYIYMFKEVYLCRKAGNCGRNHKNRRETSNTTSTDWKYTMLVSARTKMMKFGIYFIQVR